MTTRTATALGIILLGCAGLRAGADPSTAGHTEPGGIEWYPGSVAAAFASAQKSRKPVFLYWGAKWCPPCQQLKSSVFARSDFIEASRQFIAVYLDGDDPGAQKWGDVFHTAGYPTVIVLRPDKRELMRLSGGLDLSQYAEVLQTALGNVRPIAEVLAAIDKKEPLSAADCQRLAYNGWPLGDYSPAQSALIAHKLLRAAKSCTSLDDTGKARLAIDSAALSASPDAVTQALAIVHDPALASRVAGELTQLAWSDDFLKSVKTRGNPAAADFDADWIGAMDRASLNASTIDAEQLDAIAAKLVIIKSFAADQKIPAAIASDARARAKRALDKHYPPYGRAGVVNAAEGIYESLGDEEALYSLLTSEMATSTTPYYYMLDLGELEEKRGHTKEALDWYARAYQESRGIATRYSWGRRYLEALMRLTPTEHRRIRDAGIAVIGELDGPERIHDRTRTSLEKLDAQLRKWNQSHQYDQDIAAIHQRMTGVCTKIPTTDPSRNSCTKFLS
jgi:thiol-disulfide isomerase/thioredoxin